jgi:hypothetical protein
VIAGVVAGVLVILSVVLVFRRRTQKTGSASKVRPT